MDEAARDLVHRRRWVTLVVLCLALAIIGMDTTVLNVALPSLQRALSASASGLQWIVDAYTVAFAGLLLLAGAAGDRFGRKKALLSGLAVFAAASVWGANGHGTSGVIAARTAMGVGGALIMPSTLSILTNAFRDERERKRAIGIWAGVSGIGIAVGPALGGWLLEHYSWSSVFYVNVPIALVALVSGLALVPESYDRNHPPLDVPGGILSVAGLVTLVWGIIEAPDRGWLDPVVLGAFAAAAIILVGFTVRELRTAHPLLDVRFFRSRRFSIPSISITLVFFALFGTAFFLSIYLQAVQGHGALGAGVRILPLAVGMVFGAPAAMALAQRVGEKIPVVVGLLLLAGAFAVIAGTSIGTGDGRVFAAVLLMGLGMGFAMGPATEAVMGALPRSRAGVGSAVNDTVRQVGGALGVAVLGSILASVYASKVGSAIAGDPSGLGRMLPPRALGLAEDNVQSASRVAARLPDGLGKALVGHANQAFVDAMDTTVIVAGSVVLVGALVAAIFLPSHGAPTETETASAAGAETGSAVGAAGAAGAAGSAAGAAGASVEPEAVRAAAASVEPEAVRAAAASVEPEAVGAAAGADDARAEPGAAGVSADAELEPAGASSPE